ncbi:5'-nucleotidase SurE [Amylibacter marinus]|uniref:5'-nucleotidase SurE n=1 Tax=Amylibacter marinus TaxID=1475483 RepID=A0ABQ5VTV1_9RHOB|nr:5'/3'-nucleotidase SurE [Amylibacter marinus]GLQ34740.1 5'-nucleotidase SurE [Amylibacter marinus]
MKILLTNDDGLDAPGLCALYDIALGLTDEAEIFTVAPAAEQSGMGHAISYKQTIQMERRGPNRWAVHGTPADTVLLGIYNAMPTMPDLVLSGVNKGNNAAQNTLYSGTVGASLEAALQGIPAIALSQFYGPQLADIDTFDAARAHGLQTIKTLLDADIWRHEDRPIHYNVNFPPCSGADVLGHEFTTQGFRRGAPFHSEAGADGYHIIGRPQHESTGAGSDVQANMNNQIAITPCGVDLTNQSTLSRLRQL